MRHCCVFKAKDIYFLKDTALYVNRRLSIGFCPVCEKPVAELVEERFDGIEEKNTFAGAEANQIAMRLREQILFAQSAQNFLKIKPKPYGWKYGVNKYTKVNGKVKIKQIARDFYGNEEIIKIC